MFQHMILKAAPLSFGAGAAYSALALCLASPAIAQDVQPSEISGAEAVADPTNRSMEKSDLRREHHHHDMDSDADGVPDTESAGADAGHAGKALAETVKNTQSLRGAARPGDPIPGIDITHSKVDAGNALNSAADAPKAKARSHDKATPKLIER